KRNVALAVLPAAAAPLQHTGLHAASGVRHTLLPGANEVRQPYSLFGGNVVPPAWLAAPRHRDPPLDLQPKLDPVLAKPDRTRPSRSLKGHRPTICRHAEQQLFG